MPLPRRTGTRAHLRTQSRHNVVQARSFSELLGQAVRTYQDRTIETAQINEELIALARELREAGAL